MALQLDTIIPTTDGYKTVENIKIGDEVFGYENKPIKVIDVLDLYEINESYLLTFISTANESIQVITDNLHQFPVIKNSKINLINCENLKEGNIIIGLNKYLLLSKIKIENMTVRCIKVDSEEHLFLITDQIEQNWLGGSSYSYNALYTCDIN